MNNASSNFPELPSANATSDSDVIGLMFADIKKNTKDLQGYSKVVYEQALQIYIMTI